MKILITVLLTLSSFGAHSQAPSWISVSADDGSGDMVAATTNPEGDATLALRCFKSYGKCAILLIVPTSCVKGASYPMLVNSGDSSLSITGLCTTPSGRYEYGLMPFESVRDLIYRDSGFIGFATPLNSGLFKAYRFSLNNASRVLDRAFDVIRTSPPNNQKGSYEF